MERLNVAISTAPVLTLTVRLTAEEREILEEFAEEQQITDPAEVFRAMLHELSRLHDALWDAQFAGSPEVLKKLAQEARAETEAGLTEDFDPDNEPDEL